MIILFIKSIDYDIFDFIRKKKLKEDIHNKMNRLLKKLESDHDRIIVESVIELLRYIMMIYNIYIQIKIIL